MLIVDLRVEGARVGLRYIFFGALCSLHSAARAADLCSLYQEFCFGYVSTVSSGAAYPSFSDSFNLNPASLPTFLSPIGIEAIASNRGERSKSRANLSLIKGLDGVGFGAASNSDNTFFTYNLVQAFSGTGYQDRIKTFVAQNAVQSSLNFGTAFAPFVGKLLGQNFIPKVGANLRFNELTEQWDLQLGTSFNFSILNLGASHKRSAGDTSNDIPNIMTTVLTAGTKLSILNFWII